MNIKQEIKKVNNYFVDKILKKEFIVKNYEMVNETIKLNILVDGLKFCIWNCADKGSSYNGCGECFMELSFTVAQSLKLNTLIKRIKKEKYQEDEDIKGREQLKILKAKFENK